MRSPPIRDLAWVKALPLDSAVLRASRSVEARVSAVLACPAINSFEEVPGTATHLIVAGGGSLMDEAKYFRARQRTALKLTLIPSAWGSGAEVSPIVVLNRAGGKEILIGDEFLPDALVYWPELLDTIETRRARYACGDVWAHALEAFFSPLASDNLRAELATLINDMLRLPLANDPRWFQASARACALQAQASVGLVHGIAHTLEHPLRAKYPDQDWGHAKLCSIFLLPVLRLNRTASCKWTDLARRYGVDEAAVEDVVERLFEPDAFADAWPVLKENWAKILRDPSTRANGALVRARHIEAFEKQAA